MADAGVLELQGGEFEEGQAGVDGAAGVDQDRLAVVVDQDFELPSSLSETRYSLTRSFLLSCSGSSGIMRDWARRR